MKRTIIFTAMLILAAFAAACGSGAKPTAENPVKGQVIKSGPIGTGMTVKIIKRFEQKGFRLVAMKFLRASEEHLKQHYIDLKDRPFFPGRAVCQWF